MIQVQPPSNQHRFDDFWSSDPAFISAPEQPGEEATEAVREAYEKDLKEYQRKFQRARETGDWNEILVPGGQPTVFTFEPMPGDTMRALIESGYGMVVGAALAFRACIKKIRNPDIKIAFEAHEKFGTVAAVALTNRLDKIDMTIVTELGLRCFERGTTGLSPKS